MNAKWITPTVLFIGAVILIFASVADSKVGEENVLWLKIGGLIILMTGIYRASRRTDSSEQHEQDHDDRG